MVNMETRETGEYQETIVNGGWEFTESTMSWADAVSRGFLEEVAYGSPSAHSHTEHGLGPVTLSRFVTDSL